MAQGLGLSAFLGIQARTTQHPAGNEEETGAPNKYHKSLAFFECRMQAASCGFQGAEE